MGSAILFNDGFWHVMSDVDAWWRSEFVNAYEAELFPDQAFWSSFPMGI